MARNRAQALDRTCRILRGILCAHSTLFSMLALALPMGLAVLFWSARQRLWRDLVMASVVGATVLLIVPLWCARTTGDAWITPYALYSRLYFPYQRPGFGAPVPDSRRSLPPDFQAYANEFRALHTAHTIEALPGTAARRLGEIASYMCGGWRRPLFALAILGLISLRAESAFAVVSVLALFLQYLWLAHTRAWTVYYMEIQPVLAFLTAVGAWRFAEWAGQRLSRELSSRNTGLPRFEPACMVLIVVAGSVPALLDTVWARDARRSEAAPLEQFRQLTRTLPGPSILFVRYGPGHDPHRSLIVNKPGPFHVGRLDRSRSWQ